MNVSLPPVLFYGVGCLLVVFGNLRVFHLGLRKTRSDVLDDTPARRKQRRFHVLGGVVWIAMGLFLVISTVISRRASGG